MIDIKLDSIVFNYKKGDEAIKKIILLRYRPLDTKGNELPACWHLGCPVCHRTGLIDEDQYFGRVSIQCECGFHETINLSRIIKETI